MGVAILTDCFEPVSFLNLVAGMATLWLAATFTLVAASRRPGFHCLAAIEPLTAAGGIPIALAMVLSILEPFPDLSIDILGVAIVCAPLALLVLSDLSEDWAPASALNLPRRHVPTRRDRDAPHGIERCGRGV